MKKLLSFLAVFSLLISISKSIVACRNTSSPGEEENKYELNTLREILQQRLLTVINEYLSTYLTQRSIIDPVNSNIQLLNKTGIQGLVLNNEYLTGNLNPTYAQKLLKDIAWIINFLMLYKQIYKVIASESQINAITLHKDLQVMF